jgi:hypothetical protein
VGENWHHELNEGGSEMARVKADEIAARAGGAPKPRRKRAIQVTDGDVHRRAYDLYLARGCEDGHDLEDWLQAERELRPGMVSTAA